MDAMNITLPDGIGPHEEREYQLMREGKKKVAMFTEHVPLDFVKDPALLRLGRIDHPSQGVIFYMPGHEREARELASLTSESYRLQTFNADRERRIGQIFGYDERDIETFVMHVGHLLGLHPKQA